jgi:predicted nicotinamide N-methyase
MACAAAEMNAALNGVVLAVHNADPLGGDIEADLVLVGDLVYEPELETRVTRFLDETRRRGTTILYADRTTARRPPLEMEHLAHWRAPLAPPLEDDHIEHARVWSIEARAPAPRPRLGGRGRP